jgi:hypothetical protein
MKSILKSLSSRRGARGETDEGTMRQMRSSGYSQKYLNRVDI